MSIIRLTRATLAHAVMLAAVLLTLFPMLYAILVSTQTAQEYYRFPPNLLPGTGTLQNYQIAFDRAALLRLVFNTTFISLAVAAGKMILSVTAGFAFVYFDFRGKMFFFGLIFLTHMLPVPVRIVPTFQLMDQFGWVNTYWALTIPFFASATGTLLFRQLYMTIPPSLADAARIDGAGPLHFLWSIIIPISRTNLMALFLIEFIYMWNQYLWPLVIANAETTRVIQVGLKQLIATDAAVDWNIVMAGTVVAMVPPLIVLLLTQKSLVTGLSLFEEK
ncbi:MAG: ABC transporter permease subunit [Chloroflexi bacterium]|nr:ABC transporter permease subunit [Chloroflexota bacterium]